MAVVMLRAPLKDRADGQGPLDLPGDSLGEVLGELEGGYPQLTGWVLDEQGTIRRHVNVFLNGERVRSDAACRRRRVQVLPAISGGSSITRNCWWDPRRGCSSCAASGAGRWTWCAAFPGDC